MHFLAHLQLPLVQVFSPPLEKLPLMLYFILSLSPQCVRMVDLSLQRQHPLLARLEGLPVTDATLDGRLVLGLFLITI